MLLPPPATRNFVPRFGSQYTGEKAGDLRLARVYSPRAKRRDSRMWTAVHIFKNMRSRILRRCADEENGGTALFARVSNPILDELTAQYLKKT